jgi:predicted RNase H-like nuclease (RuvC/YqgF family)
MRTTTPITACLIFLATCVGCVPEQEKVQESHEPEVLILKRKNVQLRKAKEETERENIILKDSVASLSDRGQKLSKTIADQKFEMEQLRRQVEALADLPNERDRYKEQVEQLKADVIRLELELRKCGEKSSSGKTAAEKSEKKP